MKKILSSIYSKLKFRSKDPYKIQNILQRLIKRNKRVYRFKDQITKKTLYAPTLLQSDAGLKFLNFDNL